MGKQNWFYIGLDIREYSPTRDASGKKIATPTAVVTNPRGYLEQIADFIEKKYPHLKDIEWATQEDLEKLEKSLRSKNEA